jgi:uncharacterized protein (DUF934 family)
MASLIRLRTDADKTWKNITSDDPLPQQEAVIVPLARLSEALAANNLTGIGVLIEPGEDVSALAEHLSRIGIVALSFPTFRDGRNYSSARILREELGYQGEIRAVGDVLVDQLHFMVRTGIDALQLHPDVKLKSAQAALERWRHVYQKSSDSRNAVWQVREQS